MIGADYIHRIDPSALKAAGVSVVCRYLSYPSSLGKVIGKTEYDELTSNGFVVHLNWEWDARDWATSSGTTHGQEAVRQAKALGYPSGMPIIGSCDFDASPNQVRSYAIAFRDAVTNGGYRAGVYGPWDVLELCAELGYTFFWQSMSTAHSGHRNANLNPHTNLWQRGHITIGGEDCDRSDIIGGIVVVDQPQPSSDAKLKVDGQLGPLTIRAWQRIMGTTVDGFITQPPGHSSLVAAVQRRLNVHGAHLTVDGQGIAQDGHVYQTVKALQKYLGTPQDGRLSTPNSECVKAVQSRLNLGWF